MAVWPSLAKNLLAFGRVVAQRWRTGMDHFTYTYDANSNRLTNGHALQSSESK